MKTLRNVLWTVFFCVLMALPVLAQEQPLSPEQLNQLGVTAQQVEQLKVANEKVTASAGAAANLTMKKVLFANAGGNRFLWRVDFADTFPADNSNIIFYINTDNDEKTGRPNYQGIDLMIWVENGVTRAAVYAPDGKLTTAKDKVPPTAAVVQGKQLFVSADVDLHQENGETVAPMRIIAQTNKPLKAQSHMSMFVLRGAPVSQEPKAERTAH